MAAKKVASALDVLVLTSDKVHGCDAWSDNNVFEALVMDFLPEASMTAPKMTKLV